MTVLADSSIWIHYLRGGDTGPAAGFTEALKADRVATCGPVVAEVMRGAPSDRRADLDAALRGLRWAPLEFAHWAEIGMVARRLAERGQTAGFPDVAIAVAAAHGGLRVWTTDHDFERIATALPGLEVTFAVT